MATLIRPKRWGQQKPPAGTQVNRGHPLAQGLVACVLPTGGMPFDLIRNARLDQGADPTNNFVQDGTRGVVLRQNGSASGSGGWAFPDSGFVPTSSVTIMVAQRQIGSSGNQRASFGLVSATDGDRCGAHLPWTDNVVYWDFGGSGAAPNRLSASGLTFGDDVWAFTNGKRGPTIWQNAVLKASNSSAATRNATTASKYWIGNGQSATGFAGVGNIAFGFFYMWNRELTGSEIQQLYAEPYSFFTPQSPTRRLYVAASTVDLTLTDTPGSLRAAGGTQTLTLGLTAADTPTTARGHGGTDTLALGVTYTDTPTAGRAGTSPGTLTLGLTLSDTAGNSRIAGTRETPLLGVTFTDVPGAVRGHDGAQALTFDLILADKAGAARFAGTVQVYLETNPVPTPPERIYRIPPENRVYLVPAESRTYRVPAENRVMVITP